MLDVRVYYLQPNKSNTKRVPVNIAKARTSTEAKHARSLLRFVADRIHREAPEVHERCEGADCKLKSVVTLSAQEPESVDMEGPLLHIVVNGHSDNLLLAHLESFLREKRQAA